MQPKEITVVFYGRRYSRSDWQCDFDKAGIVDFLASLGAELASFGVVLKQSWEEEMVLDVRGYGDLLNTVRLRSPLDGIGNLCLGHIIGPSPNRNLLEDVRRGVNRVAFAPETIEPEGSNKVVCHNCGCGC